jgi:endogenous inhibitor of DNA gyrase (YacG/DUF329 family)
MAIVMFTCPKTGKPVPTGIETDEQSFDALVGAIKGKGRANSVQCPHCGKTHGWSSGSAYLAAASTLQQMSPGE